MAYTEGFDQTEHDRQRSLLGDSLRVLIDTREWGIFKAEVLDVMHNKAFDLFQEIDPTIPNAVIECQQMARIVRSVEDRVNQLIAEGRLAQENLRRLSEGEEHE